MNAMIGKTTPLPKCLSCLSTVYKRYVMKIKVVPLIRFFMVLEISGMVQKAAIIIMISPTTQLNNRQKKNMNNGEIH